MKISKEAITITGALLLALGLLGNARADGMAQGPEVGLEANAEPPKLHADVGLLVGVPSGDIQGVNASPAVSLSFGYDVLPQLRLFGNFRYFMVVLDNAPANVDASYYDAGAGARWMFPLSASTNGFVEGRMLRGTFGISFAGMSDESSGLGFGGRAGLEFQLSRTLSLTAAASYTTASIRSRSADWLALEASLGFGF